MKICICDDDKNIHDILTSYINNFQAEIQYDITNCFSAEDLIEHHYNNRSFDLIFLDIEMKNISGIDAAEKIRNLVPKTIIVFVSNYPHYVFDTFRVEALHFMVKPISEIDFCNVFSRALAKYNSVNSTIMLKWQSERSVIKINTIKYVEGYKRHITIYTNDGTYESIGKIPDIFKQLEPHGFIRTHQGFIVNMDQIKCFDPSDVILFDGTRVMLSVRKRVDALRAFDLYIKNRKW